MPLPIAIVAYVGRICKRRIGTSARTRRTNIRPGSDGGEITRGPDLPALEELPWLRGRPVSDRMLLPLVTHFGDGEKAVLVLELETQDALPLFDDRDARRYARPWSWIFLAPSASCCEPRSTTFSMLSRPVLDRLQALRFRLNARTRQMVLKHATKTL